MINYHKILEMHLQEISQRTISSSMGHSRDKIREVVNESKVKGLNTLTEYGEHIRPVMRNFRPPNADKKSAQCVNNRPNG